MFRAVVFVCVLLVSGSLAAAGPSAYKYTHGRFVRSVRPSNGSELLSFTGSPLPPGLAATVRKVVQAGKTGEGDLGAEKLAKVIANLASIATKSWEWGTELEALTELRYPSLSVFAASAFSPAPASSHPSAAPPADLSRIVDAALASRSPGARTLADGDGSTGDPASVAPGAFLLSAWAAGGAHDAELSGGDPDRYRGPAWEQIESLMDPAQTPRSPAGAMSHRSSSVQLWADFMYMAPPALAYAGALSSNASLMVAAYRQCALQRSALLDGPSSLWRHIAPGSDGDPTDSGLWSTGNAWAAAGLVRVLATLVNGGGLRVEGGAGMVNDLGHWACEIVNAAWGLQDPATGLLPNYFHADDTFLEASGTALLAATTFRLASYAPRGLSPASLTAAAFARTRLNTACTSDGGWVGPVVDPLQWRKAGARSPEAQAFVVLLEAAWRDFRERYA